MRRSLLVLSVASALLMTTTPADAAPMTRTPFKAIEAPAARVLQTTCSPTAKPGTTALRSLVMAAYKGTGDYGIVRACSVGGRSEHKEGRAWDWKVNVKSPTQVAQVNDLFRWLFATDKYGNKHAQARRLGIMYIIWNKRIWSAYSPTWRAYTGANAHTDHVHISLSWAGARKQTSYWTGKVAGPVAAPVTAPKPAPAPTAAPKPAPVPTYQPLATNATVTVPATAAGVTTPFLLEEGRRYLVRATGVYSPGAGRQADAECSRRADGSWERRTGDDGSLLDLEIGDRETRWWADSRADCDAAHGYVTVIEPRSTGRVLLRVNDTSYADNTGALKAVVTRL